MCHCDGHVDFLRMSDFENTLILTLFSLLENAFRYHAEAGWTGGDCQTRTSGMQRLWEHCSGPASILREDCASRRRSTSLLLLCCQQVAQQPRLCLALSCLPFWPPGHLTWKLVSLSIKSGLEVLINRQYQNVLLSFLLCRKLLPFGAVVDLLKLR